MSVFYHDGNWKPTQPGSFYPVSFYEDAFSGDHGTMHYNGNSHSISGINVRKADADPDFLAAGIFGTYVKGSIQNLELLDSNISGGVSVGALAGAVSHTTVSNVIARNTHTNTGVDIQGSSKEVNYSGTPENEGQAGGLIGIFSEGKIQNCAASLTVYGAVDAGGLIGKCGPNSVVTGCYSGGHTKDGSYELWLNNATPDDNTDDHPYDVTGTTAGGLIGNAGSAEISNSYSTCSVSGTTAGGFAGSAIGSITNCYATGLVSGTTKYAFLADGTPTLSGNYYYMTINEVPSTKPNAKPDETEPMLPYSGYVLTSHMSSVSPIDLNAAVYNGFTGEWVSWNPASAYDSALDTYYSGKYTLKTIDELTGTAAPTGYTDWNDLFVSTHYGDWPSPEVFFINTN